MGEHEKCCLFYKEELKLLIELIVDLFKFPIEDLNTFWWDDVITHEGTGQIGHQLKDTLRMKQYINDFLLRDICEELLGFWIDLDMRDERRGGKLIVEVEDKSD